MAEKAKKKKAGLFKRIGIKLFKKALYFTSKNQLEEYKKERSKEFETAVKMLQDIQRGTPIQYANTLLNYENNLINFNHRTYPFVNRTIKNPRHRKFSE